MSLTLFYFYNASRCHRSKLVCVYIEILYKFQRIQKENGEVVELFIFQKLLHLIERANSKCEKKKQQTKQKYRKNRHRSTAIPSFVYILFCRIEIRKKNWVVWSICFKNSIKTHTHNTSFETHSYAHVHICAARNTANTLIDTYQNRNLKKEKKKKPNNHQQRTTIKKITTTILVR